MRGTEVNVRLLIIGTLKYRSTCMYDDDSKHLYSAKISVKSTEIINVYLIS